MEMLHAFQFEGIDNPQSKIQDDEESDDLSPWFLIAEAMRVTASSQTIDDERGLHNHLHGHQNVKSKPAVVLHGELSNDGHNAMDKVERQWYEKENIVQKSNRIVAHIQLSYLVKGKADCQQTYQSQNPFLDCVDDHSFFFVTFCCHANEENDHSYDGGE